MMKYRLGLDLGTNSIGWAIVELDSEDKVSEVIKTGVRIFSDGRVPGKDKTSLAVARRGARSARRRRDRRLQSKQTMIKYLEKMKLFPLEKEEREKLKSLNPYQLRSEGLDRKLKPFELGRVLHHFMQRRGFKSNRKSLNSEEGGSLSPKIDYLDSLLDECQCRTYGEFLYKERFLKDKSVRIKGDADFYPTREHYSKEFDALRSVQEKFHTHIKEEDWQKIENIIFFQRPLKSVDVGKCQIYFEDKEKRAHFAYPSYQDYLLYKNLKDFKIRDFDQQKRDLSPDEEEILKSHLLIKKEDSFQKLKELLGLEDEETITLETERRKKLKGNETNYWMQQKKYFGKKWMTLSSVEKDVFIKALLFDEDENDQKLNSLFEEHNIPPENREAILKLTNFPPGVGRFCLKALREMNDLMINEGLRQEEAQKQLEEAQKQLHPQEGEGELSGLLEYYGKVLPESVVINEKLKNNDNKKDLSAKYGRVSNPTVHIGLGQLQKVVNKLIEVYGKPAEIHIEIVKDLKHSSERKKEREKQQRKNQERNERIKKDLEENKFPVNRDNITKYKLWEELGGINDRLCPYSGKKICLTNLFSESSDFEIEHILPWSRTLDDSMANKTLSWRSANREKGDRSPYEAFGGNEKKYLEILNRVQALPKGKRWRFSKAAMDEFKKNNGWLSRQLNDTAYLSKISAKYLQTICPKITVLPGRLTSLLRCQWGLNEILKDNDKNTKNRNDHRHHAIDAVVVALTDTRALQMASKASKRNNQLKVSSPIKQLRDQAEQCIDETIVSHRVDHSKHGQFHKESNYGQIDPPVDKKYNLVIRKPLLDLKPSFLIRDQKIRTEIEEIRKNKESKSKLEEYMEENNIRSVRILKTNQSHQKIYHPKADSGPHKRHVIPGDIHHIGFWQVPGKDEIQAKGVSVFDYNRKKAHEHRPHPAAKLLLKLHKGDSVRFEKDDNEILGRIVLLCPSSSNSKIVILPIHLAKELESNPKDNDLKKHYIAFSKIKTYKLRLVHIDEIGQIKDGGCKIK